MEVDKALVDLELVAIPGLRTLTARLEKTAAKLVCPIKEMRGTYSLTGGDLEDLGGEADGALDAELLVLSTVDQVLRDYSPSQNNPFSIQAYLRTLLEVLDVAARERDTDLVDLGRGDGGTRGVVFLFTLSDVTHPCCLGESDGDLGEKMSGITRARHQE